MNSTWCAPELTTQLGDSASEMKKVYKVVMDLIEGRQLLPEDKLFYSPIIKALSKNFEAVIKNLYKHELVRFIWALGTLGLIERVHFDLLSEHLLKNDIIRTLNPKDI